MLVRKSSQNFITTKINFERFSHSNGAAEVIREKWWPQSLTLAGIPALPTNEKIKKMPDVLKHPRNSCENTEIVVIIKTAIKNNELRDIMREIFMLQKQENMDLFFITGRNKNFAERLSINPNITFSNLFYSLVGKVNRETDMISADFEDTYKNLPLKTFSAHKWFNQMCPKAKWLFLHDDDAFVRKG